MTGSTPGGNGGAAYTPRNILLTGGARRLSSVDAPVDRVELSPPPTSALGRFVANLEALLLRRSRLYRVARRAQAREAVPAVQGPPLATCPKLAA